MKLINTSLLSQPLNWFIVWLMLAIGAAGVFYLAKSAGISS